LTPWKRKHPSARLIGNSFKLGEQVLVAELLSINMAPYENIVVVNKGALAFIPNSLYLIKRCRRRVSVFAA
jgi:hypothetical protein